MVDHLTKYIPCVKIKCNKLNSYLREVCVMSIEKTANIINYSIINNNIILIIKIPKWSTLYYFVFYRADTISYIVNNYLKRSIIFH